MTVSEFKARSLAGPCQPTVGLCEALSAKPHELTILGSEIGAVEAKAKELGGSITILCTVTGHNAWFRAIFNWGSYLNGGTLHQLNRKADDARQKCGNTTQREPRRARPHHSENTNQFTGIGIAEEAEARTAFDRDTLAAAGSTPASPPTINSRTIDSKLIVPEPDTLESSLARIKQAMVRNRRDRELSRRFGRVKT